MRYVEATGFLVGGGVDRFVVGCVVLGCVDDVLRVALGLDDRVAAAVCVAVAVAAALRDTVDGGVDAALVAPSVRVGLGARSRAAFVPLPPLLHAARASGSAAASKPMRTRRLMRRPPRFVSTSSPYTQPGGRGFSRPLRGQT